MAYDVAAFIDRLVGRDLATIHSSIQREIAGAEAGCFSVRGAATKRKSGALEYAAGLKRISFILHTGGRPDGIRSDEAAAAKRLLTVLVDQGVFTPEILNLL
jgi:hypothetical protein